jgi:asparagine synthase (glutamine-hydrolysing)
MMNSLEVRVPLLDHKLAEFVAQLPTDLKLRGRDTKYALKQVVRRRLPPEILQRPKMGFGVPMREWVASELRDFTHQYLLDQSRASGVLDARVVRQMVDDNEKRLYRSSSGGKLWWALFFEIWYQDVYNSPAPGPRRTDLARPA